MLSSRDSAAASMDLKRTDIPEKRIAGLASPPPVLNPIRAPHPLPFHPQSWVPSSVGRGGEEGCGRKRRWGRRQNGVDWQRKGGARGRENGARGLGENGVRQKNEG